MAPREFYQEIASTQLRAVELARRGAGAGQRVVARRQTGGLGRDGHVWESPTGGLYLSLVLGAPPRSGGLLSLGIGAFLARDLAARTGTAILLKWPNDLVARPDGGPARKLGGILIDRIAAPDGRPSVVVGLGINVAPLAGRLSDGLRSRSVALEELTGVPLALEPLEEEVCRSALGAHGTLDRPGGAAEVLALCRALLHGVGARVAIDGRPSGRLVGIAEDGALRLLADGAWHDVRAGTVSVEEGAPA